jgi:hypothetical protein
MTNPAGGWAAPTMPTGIGSESTATAPVQTGTLTDPAHWTAPTMPAGVTGQQTSTTTPASTDPTGSTTTPASGTPATSGTPADGSQPAGPQPGDLTGGWQVTPDQVKQFAHAVQQVRSDLVTVFHQVDQLTSPAYLPQLGSSPVGQALTAKFLDRLSGSQGLLSNLYTVLNHLDQFVTNAEQVAAQYEQTESSTSDGMQSL